LFGADERISERTWNDVFNAVIDSEPTH
jgi:hypothetical protein